MVASWLLSGGVKFIRIRFSHAARFCCMNCIMLVATPGLVLSPSRVLLIVSCDVAKAEHRRICEFVRFSVAGTASVGTGRFTSLTALVDRYGGFEVVGNGGWHVMLFALEVSQRYPVVGWIRRFHLR